jgi:GNAT superfamily N-acetyltransferase
LIQEVSQENFSPFFNLMAEVECGRHFDFNNDKHVKWLQKRIASHFFRGAKFFAQYLDDGRPVGFAALLLDESIYEVVRWAELLDIGIFGDVRNCGYGSELLQHTEDYARQAGAHCMYMSTYAKDYKVIAFYGRNGFVPVATLPDVEGAGDEGIVFMRKVLDT